VRIHTGLVAVLVLAAASGCLLRGNVELTVHQPEPDAVRPGSLLIDAIQAGGGDPNTTRVFEYRTVFTEDGHLKILDVRVETHPPGGGERFYLTYLVGQDYEPAGDRVFRGFKHDERDQADRPDPAKEWALSPEILEALDRATLGELAQHVTHDLPNGSYVLEYRVRPDCVAEPDEEGSWRVLNATSAGLVDAGAGHDLVCFARPQLPPTGLVIAHVPCIRGPTCPDGDANALAVDYDHP
jgi:hypothetical protein